MIIIVNCEKCGSKLKVDNAKIPESGIMARCSFCSHRFHLKKESEKKDSGSESTIWPENGSTPVNPEQQKNETRERIDAPRPGGPSPREEFEMLARLRNREGAKAAPVATSANQPETQEKTASGWDFTSFYPENEKGERAVAAPLNSEPSPEAGRTVEPSVIHGSGSSPATVQGLAPTEPVRSAHGYPLPDHPPAAGAPVENREFVQQTVARTPDMIITEPQTAARSMSGSSAERAYSAATEYIQSPPPVETRAAFAPQHAVPEIVTDDRRISSLSGLQQPGREIVTVLDAHGMNDEYLVKAVKDVCEATRFVEGVERPDWPTRLLGLDMLARIKGVYPLDKKDDPAKRQLQIVTGINV